MDGYGWVGWVGECGGRGGGARSLGGGWAGAGIVGGEDTTVASANVVEQGATTGDEDESAVASAKRARTSSEKNRLLFMLGAK